jgi:serine/threonine protein phosphatase PrpC
LNVGAELERIVDKNDANAHAPRRLCAALVETFHKLDSDMQEQYVASDGYLMNAGTTANACIVTPTHVICGNAGDTRCVLYSNGVVVPLSYDHKPSLQHEKERIALAGGTVERGRVNGCLAVSRALGDFEFKRRTDLDQTKQQVVSTAEVKMIPRTPEDEFLLIACDGEYSLYIPHHTHYAL